MAYPILLPEDDSSAEKVYQNWVSAGEQARNPLACNWFINHWYLRGVRNFNNINYSRGTVEASYIDESGTLRFRYEEIVSRLLGQIGRLMSLNLSPATKAKGVSLDGLRKSSIAQACLNVAFPDQKVLALKQAIIPPLLTYGTLGLIVWYQDQDSMGIEIVPPWELLPVPADVPIASGVRGRMRVRYVPKRWLEGLAILDKGGKLKLDEADSISVATGQIPNPVYSKFQGTLAATGMGSTFVVERKRSGLDSPQSEGKDEITEELVKMGEVWLDTPDDYLGEYHIFAGNKRIYKQSFAQNKIYSPCQVIRHTEVGFFGRSYVDQLMPLNAEMEYTIAKVFQNIQDLDQNGVLCLATSLGIPADAIESKDGRKILRYEADYTAQYDTKPFAITPVNSGAFPVQGLKVGLDLMDRIANQPTEMMQGGAPGRVDSAAALGMLNETAGISLSPIARNIAIGVSGCYRAMLGIIRGTWGDDKIVNVNKLDDSLAGLVFDAKTGEMKLAKNAIPHPDEVTVTVASEIPISDELQKMELKEALKDMTITPTEYRIEVRKRGLTLPVGNEQEWQNYRRAMLENLLLFGDGQTPNDKAVIVAERDMHLIHLMVLDAFMARPEFYLASPGVRELFEQHRQKHLTGLGVLPKDMPPAEDAAAESEEMMAMQQKQMGGEMEQGQPQQTM